MTVGGRTFALDAHEYADGTLDGRGWELQESFLLDGSHARPGASPSRTRSSSGGSGWPAARTRRTSATGSRAARGRSSSRSRHWRRIVSFHGATRAGPAPAVDRGRGRPARPLRRRRDPPAVVAPGCRRQRRRGLVDRLPPPRGDGPGRGRPERPVPRRGRSTGRSGPAGRGPSSCRPRTTPDLDGEDALNWPRHATTRTSSARPGGDRLSPFVRQLVIAADAFIVRRDAVAQGDGDPLAEGEGRSIIAGYPWFNDWGRDTMIALPGPDPGDRAGRPRRRRSCGRSAAGSSTGCCPTTSRRSPG